MQGKKEIIIDSCVFFKMIGFNDRFEEKGMEGVKELVKHWEKSKNIRLKNILDSLPEDYCSKNKRFSDEQLVEGYKEYINNEIAQSIKKIKNSIMDMVGCYARNKADKPDNQAMGVSRTPDEIKADYESIKEAYSFMDGEQFKEMFADIEKSYGDFTQLKDCKSLKISDYQKKYGKSLIDDCRKRIDEEYKRYIQLQKDYETYIIRKEIYKTAADTYDVGKLFIAAKEGEYSLNVVSVGFDEIMNHVAENYPNGAPENFLTYSREQVASMAQNCTLISINNEFAKNDNFIEYVDSLAELLRTVGEGDKSTKPMAQDINSVHQYGDSTIAAMSLLIGYVLITQNGKDFIGDKKDEEFKIREHIKKYSDQLSGALPYSVRELLEGKADLKTRLPEGISLVDVKNKNSIFAEEKELGWA